MNHHRHTRIAAASGAVSALVLFVANGQGGDLPPWRDVAAAGALTLLVVFAAYLAALLRRRADDIIGSWLALAVIAGATAGSTLKLVSGVPGQALDAAGIPPGSAMTHAFDALGTALTTTALVPLAMFCLAAGSGALRTRILPRWLGLGGLVTGAALAVNACFTTSESVPALLLLALWCIAASVHLVRVDASYDGGSSTADPAVGDRRLAHEDR
jgi:hypothetical protein